MTKRSPGGRLSDNFSKYSGLPFRSAVTFTLKRTCLYELVKLIHFLLHVFLLLVVNSSLHCHFLKTKIHRYFFKSLHSSFLTRSCIVTTQNSPQPRQYQKLIKRRAYYIPSQLCQLRIRTSPLSKILFSFPSTSVSTIDSPVLCPPVASYRPTRSRS
jgi:hypothetical protein